MATEPEPIVLELVIRANGRANAKWLLEQIKQLLEDGIGQLDAAVIVPAAVYDEDVKGVPA